MGGGGSEREGGRGWERGRDGREGGKEREGRSGIRGKKRKKERVFTGPPQGCNPSESELTVSLKLGWASVRNPEQQEAKDVEGCSNPEQPPLSPDMLFHDATSQSKGLWLPSRKQSIFFFLKTLQVEIEMTYFKKYPTIFSVEIYLIFSERECFSWPAWPELGQAHERREGRSKAPKKLTSPKWENI